MSVREATDDVDEEEDEEEQQQQQQRAAASTAAPAGAFCCSLLGVAVTGGALVPCLDVRLALRTAAATNDQATAMASWPPVLSLSIPLDDAVRRYAVVCDEPDAPGAGAESDAVASLSSVPSLPSLSATSLSTEAAAATRARQGSSSDRGSSRAEALFRRSFDGAAPPTVRCNSALRLTLSEDVFYSCERSNSSEQKLLCVRAAAAAGAPSPLSPTSGNGNARESVVRRRLRRSFSSLSSGNQQNVGEQLQPAHKRATTKRVLENVGTASGSD